MRPGTPALRRALAAGSALALVALAGCAQDPNGQQSILNPQGERAQSVHGLWLLMLGLGTLVWLIVTTVLVIAIVKRRRRAAKGEGADLDALGDEPAKPEPRSERRSFWVVAASGAIVPALVLGALTFVSASVLADTDPEQDTDGPLIEVIAHQYWWEVTYPELGVTTANEIHIPTGSRVRVELTSEDVIHSFWVPELGGKMDAVPGTTNALWLAADDPGTYWGQCAEYCGADHALMRMLVIAHDQEEFEGWAQRQSLPAAPEDIGLAEPEDPDVERGREIFMSSSCVYCHTIEGTAALGDVGPDLTHLASRRTIAAGILPNERGQLAGWILDPQSIKPGNLMPGTDLDGVELQQLLDYLESLE
ncbi:cytochrome c oxidase subunit II [Microbacterium sp. LRZ72]|uniref:cytochrome c oxidase subunit II n=1 Tax=Microbacterium sp. LRZ72 TaxID=2942481 RepID=UPI0029A3F7A4|nr:cytochrome c oxidase subunit II [Microbacterium sp. LRZ72]MDX2377261.1 cytochrome c oxidase subunit II [Microbacterium sp. LRZ72]